MKPHEILKIQLYIYPIKSRYISPIKSQYFPNPPSPGSVALSPAAHAPDLSLHPWRCRPKSPPVKARALALSWLVGK